MTVACDSPGDTRNGASQHAADTHANAPLQLQADEPPAKLDAKPDAKPDSNTTTDQTGAKYQGTDEQKAAATIQALYRKHAERRAKQGMHLFKRPEKVLLNPIAAY